MSWTIDLLSPDGGTLVAQRTEFAPSGVTGDLTWSLSRDGSCLNGSFTADATRFPVRGTQTVQLRVDGVPWFFGVVAEAPNPRDPNWGEVKLDGASRLLEKRRLDAHVFVDMDVGEVARELVRRYRHSALLYDPEMIPDVGRRISRFSLPYRKLSEALDALGKTVSGTEGIPFGVLPDRRVFFGARPGAAPALPYADTEGLRWLRVTTDDVVTRAYLIALSRSRTTASLQAYVFPPESQVASTELSGRPPYRPATYVSMAELPEAAHVGWEDTRLAPAGADILGKGVLGKDFETHLCEGFAAPEAAMDGDPSTVSTNLGDIEFAHLSYSQNSGIDASPIVGFRVVYALNAGADAAKYQTEVQLTYYLPGSQGGNAMLVCSLVDTAGKTNEVTAVLPLPQELADAISLPPLTPQTPTPYQAIFSVHFVVRPVAEGTPRPKLPAGAFQVYTVEALTYDRLKADALAQKMLVPPASVPSEFRVKRLLSPSREYALIGAPGGDLTGSVAEFEYRHGTQGLTTTTVKLEQPGASETARIIRLAAQTQAQDAQAQLRGYLEAP